MSNPVSVTKDEFISFIYKSYAAPDGFKINGGSIQTSFVINNKEVARHTQDGFGEVWEILDKEK